MENSIKVGDGQHHKHMERELRDSSEPIAIPPEVAICPYCKTKLTVHITGGVMEDDGTWSVDCIQIDCESEPDIDSPEWQDWIVEHTDMPYVYMLPVDVKIQRWINERYRFKD